MAIKQAKRADEYPVVDDDADYIAESEKLKQVQLDRSKVEKQISLLKNEPPETVEAKQVKLAKIELDGGTVEDSGPTYHELMQRSQVLARAEQMQTERLYVARAKAARKIADEMNPEYQELVRQFVDMQIASFEAYERMLAFRQDSAIRAKGDCLREFRINEGIRNQFMNGFNLFKTLTEHFRTTGDASNV